MALKSFLGFLMLIPITGASRISFDQQIANLSRSHQLAIVIDDPSFVSGNEFATRSGLRFTRTVRDYHLQSFCGAQRIEDLNAKAPFETLKEWGRQRLTRGDGVANAGKIEFFSIVPSMRK